MDDETAKASQESHLSHCRACKFMIMNHSMSGDVKTTIKLMAKEIEDWENKEKREFKG